MLKPLHALDGCLSADITAFADLIFLDNESTALIVANMDADDVTYIAVGEAPSMEVMRLRFVNSTYFEVTRGADDTTATAFPINTPVKYILAYDMVQEMIDAISPVAFDVVGTSPVNVADNGSGTFTVSIDPTTITSPDGTINVLGAYPDFKIDIERGAFGCCEE